MLGHNHRSAPLARRRVAVAPRHLDRGSPASGVNGHSAKVHRAPNVRGRDRTPIEPIEGRRLPESDGPAPRGTAGGHAGRPPPPPPCGPPPPPPPPTTPRPPP